MTVTLGKGLEEIGVVAFMACTPLLRIEIPNTIKKIKENTFSFAQG
jgi:hypothetical protein